MTRPRSTLALRIALLTCAIAVMTAVIAGGLAVRLMGQANERSARQTLSRLADAAQDTADTATFPQNGEYEIVVNTAGKYATGQFSLSVTSGSKAKSVARCSRSS